jgi:hypothetical protein
MSHKYPSQALLDLRRRIAEALPTMKQRLTHATLLLALVGVPAYAADVYRSTGPDGTVSFSDRPQGADAEFVRATRSATTAAAPAAEASGRNAAAPAPAAPPDAPGDPTLPEGPSADQLREQRQKNCEIARERQARYALSRRLFRTDAAGAREYLDDAAVAEARTKAAADVQDWCD